MNEKLCALWGCSESIHVNGRDVLQCSGGNVVQRCCDDDDNEVRMENIEYFANYEKTCQAVTALMEIISGISLMECFNVSVNWRDVDGVRSRFDVGRQNLEYVTSSRCRDKTINSHTEDLFSSDCSSRQFIIISNKKKGKQCWASVMCKCECGLWFSQTRQIRWIKLGRWADSIYQLTTHLTNQMNYGKKRRLRRRRSKEKKERRWNRLTEAFNTIY